MKYIIILMLFGFNLMLANTQASHSVTVNVVHENIVQIIIPEDVEENSFAANTFVTFDVKNINSAEDQTNTNHGAIGWVKTDGINKKVLVETNLSKPKFNLFIKVVSSSDIGAIASDWMTVQDFYKSLINRISAPKGSFYVKFKATRDDYNVTGTDIHHITYTLLDD